MAPKWPQTKNRKKPHRSHQTQNLAYRVTHSNRITLEAAWKLVRDLAYMLPIYRWESGLNHEVSQKDFERLNDKSRLLFNIRDVVEKFAVQDKKHDLDIFAKHLHPVLENIYKRVKSGKLSVKESEKIILTEVKSHFASVSAMGCPYDDETLVRILVKTSAQISPGVSKGTSAKGGRNSKTGPATIADYALGQLLNTGGRRTHDKRRGKDFDLLRFNYRDVGNVIPGINDRPYFVIIETLVSVFDVDLESAFKFVFDLGMLPGPVLEAFEMMQSEDSVEQGTPTSGLPALFYSFNVRNETEDK